MKTVVSTNQISRGTMTTTNLSVVGSGPILAPMDIKEPQTVNRDPINALRKP